MWIMWISPCISQNTLNFSGFFCGQKMSFPHHQQTYPHDNSFTLSKDCAFCTETYN